MRSPAEIEAEIARLEKLLTDGRRRPQYQSTALSLRAEALKWALGLDSLFD